MKNKRALRRRIRRLLPAMLYGGAVLLWLLWALIGFLAGQARQPDPLDLAAVQTENLLAEASGNFTSENEDPYLVFEGIGQTVRFVRLDAAFETAPGELDAYYTTKAGHGFSPRKRVIGVPQADGSVLYTLPPFTRVQDLRLDLGTVGGNAITVQGVTLHPKLSAAHYFVPSLRQAMGLAVWPALALCAIYTIIEETSALAHLRAKRKAAA